MAIRDDFVAGEVLLAQDLDDTFGDKVSKRGGDTITASSASVTNLRLVGASSPTGNLLEARRDDNTAVSYISAEGRFVRYSDDDGVPFQALQQNDDATGATIRLSKSRGGIGSASAVQLNDNLGYLVFQGYDGSSYISGAQIRAVLTLTPGASDMPTALIFSTTADGSASLSERMRLAPDGLLSLGGDTDTGFKNTGSGIIDIFSNNNNTTRLSTDGLYVNANAYSLSSSTDVGIRLQTVGWGSFYADGQVCLYVSRQTNDGSLVQFRQGGTFEGDISVAGNTVSYNAFMGSHYTEFTDDVPLRGTVMESIDELVEGAYHQQDRLPKTKISDTIGSKSVYGVYFCEAEGIDGNPPTGHLVAALGASWVRIAEGVTVQRGDLLESNGDGCARVQADDLIRSSTIGKVSAATVVETYDDGSFVVPCVLMCG